MGLVTTKRDMSDSHIFHLKLGGGCGTNTRDELISFVGYSLFFFFKRCASLNGYW